MKLIPLTPPTTSDRLLVYFPGMDGSGTLIQPQLRHLNTTFEVWGLAIPTHDRRTWGQLVADAAQLIRSLRRKRHQELYLCGESFGACLALHLIQAHPNLSDRLILINSASAFAHHPWLRWSVPLVRWFAPSLYGVATHGLLPFLAEWNRVPEPSRHLLLTAMKSVKPESAAWRMALLDRLELSPQMISHPTLIIASKNDRLLPSVDESRRLAAQCLQSQRLLLPHSGHTCLLEPEVNLMQLLKQANFLPAKLGDREQGLGIREQRDLVANLAHSA